MAVPFFPVFEFNVDDPYLNTLNHMKNTAMKKMLPVESRTHPINFHFPSHLEGLGSENEQIKGFIEECNRERKPDKYFKENKITVTSVPTQTASCFDFANESQFEPEILSLRNLQILRVEPWSDLICDSNIPINSIYSTSLPIQVHPIPFQDPLKQEQFPLEPAIPQLELQLEKIPLTSDIVMDFKDIQYPSSPTYDHLLEILQDKFQNATVKSPVKKEPSFPSPDMINNHTISPPVEATELQQEQAVHIQACEIEVEMPVDFIELDLQGLSAEMILMLEEKLLSCWNDLMGIDLNPPMDQLKDYQSKLHQLDPQISRQFLSFLEETLTLNKKEPTLPNSGNNFKVMLPDLLLFHGLNKTIDVYLNIDFELAYQMLLDFKKTHQRNLKDECKPLLIHLYHLIQNENEPHPKLTELKLRVARHLDENGDSKVWIRLHRFAKEISRKIQHVLAGIGLQCALDPRMFDSDLPVFRPSEYERVFVSDRVLEGFPFSLVSLIIDYECPMKLLKSDGHSATVKRIALQVRRVSNVKVLETVVAPEVVVAAEATENDEDCELLSCNSTPAEMTMEENVVESESNQSEGLELIVSSTLKWINQLKDHLKSVASINILEYDYSFLDESAVYQPDILVSWKTAVLVIPAEEFSDMKQIRLKVLMACFKCTECWIIGLGADANWLTTAPYFWNPLTGLIRFYEQSHPKFRVRFRLAVNIEQVASILADIAVDERRLGNIQSHHRRYSDDREAKLLLYFPCFNAISSHIVLQDFSLVDLLTLSLETLNETIQIELLEKIKVFRESMNEPFCSADSSDYASECISHLTSSYGKLKVCWSDRMEPSATLQSTRSPKKLKLEGAESTVSLSSS